MSGPLRILLFILPFTCVEARSALVLSDGLSFTEDQIAQLEEALPKLSEDLILYHWTKPEVGARWYRQGGLDQDEVNFYNTPSGDRQVYGAGIYFAIDDRSSSEFGTFLTTWKIPKGRPLYDEAIVRAFTNRRLSDEEITELGKRIPFLRKITSNWYLTHHAANLANPLVPQFAKFIRMEPSYLRVRELLRSIHAVDERTEGFLDSLYHLASYSDGLNLYRAIAVNPSNPWNEFEPQNFEFYRGARRKFLDQATDNHQRRITNGYGKFGSYERGLFSFPNPKKWVQEQIQFLMQIASEVQGSAAEIRKGEVRGGGDLEGGRFLATHSQVAALDQNPYLEVNVIPDPQGRGLLAEYYYPDVFHYKKLKGILPNELYQKIESFSAEELKHNSALREELNQELIRALLMHFFMSIYDQTTDFSKLMATLISIHPFGDFNGRSVRIYAEIAAAEGRAVPHHLFESDLDILTTTQALKHNLSRSSSSYHQLIQELFGETFEALTHKRMPIYYRPAILDTLVGAYHLGEKDQKLEISSEDLELIRRRNITELYNRHIGLGWDLNEETYDGALALAIKTTTLDLFRLSLREALLRRSELNAGNLALWGRVRMTNNQTGVLSDSKIAEVERGLSEKVISEMKSIAKDLNELLKAPNIHAQRILSENSKLHELFKRWQELERFFGGQPNAELESLKREIIDAIFLNIRLTAKAFDQFRDDSLYGDAARRLALYARFLKDEPEFKKGLVLIAEAFYPNGRIPVRGANRLFLSIVQNLHSIIPLELNQIGRELLPDFKDVLKLMTDNFSDDPASAAALGGILIHGSSDVGSSDKFLAELEALALRILETSTPFSYPAVLFIMERGVSPVTILKILNSNLESKDPLRLETNSLLGRMAAPLSSDLTLWHLKHGHDEPQSPWRLGGDQSLEASPRPYQDKILDFSLHIEKYRPQGLSLEAQLSLAREIIKSNLGRKEHDAWANQLLRSAAKDQPLNEYLVEALHDRGKLEKQTIEALVKRCSMELASGDLRKARSAARVLNLIGQGLDLASKSLKDIKELLKKDESYAANIDLWWLLAFASPNENESRDFLMRWGTENLKLMGTWLEEQEGVDTEILERGLSSSIKPGIFGPYADQSFLGSVGNLMRRDKGNPKLWEMGIAKFVDDRVFESVSVDLLKKAGAPSLKVRQALEDGILAKLPQGKRNRIYRAWNLRPKAKNKFEVCAAKVSDLAAVP